MVTVPLGLHTGLGVPCGGVSIAGLWGAGGGDGGLPTLILSRAELVPGSIPWLHTILPD